MTMTWRPLLRAAAHRGDTGMRSVTAENLWRRWLRVGRAVTGALVLGMLLTVLSGSPEARAGGSPLLRDSDAIVTGQGVGFHQLVGGREATITYFADEPTVFSWQLKQGGTVVRASRQLGPGDIPESGAGPAERGGAPSYATMLTVHVEPLQSNTEYTLEVTGTTRSGRRIAPANRFRTQRQRVRITLEQISIEDDGDGFGKGNGELLWTAGVTWPGGEAAGCYPNNDPGGGFGGFCQHGSFSEATYFPRNTQNQALTWLFAEENFDAMPNRFVLGAEVEESDVPIPLPQLEYNPPPDTFVWQTPARGDVASTRGQVRALGDGALTVLTFTLEMYHEPTIITSLRRNQPTSTWRGPFGQ